MQTNAYGASSYSLCMEKAHSSGNVIFGAYMGHVETSFESLRVWISW